MVIFFDIDDTLVDSELAHKKAIRTVSSEFSLINKISEHIDLEWLSITDKYLKLYFDNQITLCQQRHLRIMEFWNSNGQQITEEQARIIYQRYHLIFLHSCHCFIDTISTLGKLQDYKLGIISNGTYSDQIFKLEHNHLAPFFHKIIVSEKVGFSKPDKEIFRIAARQINLPLSDCIYIGNSYDLDYLASLNSGMKAIWLDRKSTQNDSQSETIHSLIQLVNHPYLNH